MIEVRRLRGEPMFVNADFIEAIESTPDTVLTLLDGRRLIVADTPDEVVAAIRRFRASVLYAVDQLRDTPADVLRLVADEG